VEPTLAPDVGYTEVVAVALAARGTLVSLPGGRQISLGEFMLRVIFRQMRELGRHPRTFVRVDRRNSRSLGLCDRVGLVDERTPAPGASNCSRTRRGTVPVEAAAARCAGRFRPCAAAA